jgi:hypothetical protein
VPIHVARELSRLQRMTTAELRREYAKVFAETTNVNNRPWLVKRIAWRLQELAEGGLSERARQRAAELANDADLRMNPPKDLGEQEPEADSPPPAPEAVTLPLDGDRRLPSPGTVLARPYKGRTVQVLIRPDGFEFEGVVYPSLSAAAGAVTGSHVNGFLFFKNCLNGKGTDR